jgi:hypothetical protein
MTVGPSIICADMPRYPAACQIGTPRCISHVAAVCRNVCGVTLPHRPASLTACLKLVLTDLTGAPCHSTKCEVTMPRRTHRRIWARSRGGMGGGGLPLVGRTATDCQPVVDALVEIDERVADVPVRRCRRDRARPRAGVESNKDEPRQMPKRPLVGLNRLPLLAAAVHGLLFAVPPTRPDQLCGFVAGQPAVARRSLRRQSHPYDAVVEVLLGVMVDRCAESLKVGASASGLATGMCIDTGTRPPSPPTTSCRPNSR